MSDESVRADVKEAKEHLETLDKLIEEENYFPGKIFNLNEPHLLEMNV
jgi:hypothetical protein